MPLKIVIDPAKHQYIGLGRAQHRHHRRDLRVAVQNVAQQKPRTVAFKFRVVKPDADRLGPGGSRQQTNR